MVLESLTRCGYLSRLGKGPCVFERIDDTKVISIHTVMITLSSVTGLPYFRLPELPSGIGPEGWEPLVLSSCLYCSVMCCCHGCVAEQIHAVFDRCSHGH